MRPGGRWSLRRRFTVTVALVTTALVALSLAVTIGFFEVVQSQTRITGTLYVTVTRSAALMNAYLDEETGVRGFALTGIGEFLLPYTDGLAAEAGANAELDRNLASEPALASSLTQVRAAAAAWHENYATPLVQEVTRAGRSSAAAAAAAVQATGKELFDRIRVAYDRYESATVATRNAALGTLTRGRTLLLAAFGSLTALVLIAGVLLRRALHEWVLTPLDAVRADVQEVADGALDRPVRALGPPELDQLGHDVERMRRRIVAEYTAAVSAGRIVDEQRLTLERQAEDLRRSNAELEQFAYVASHDLQEPLRKVASFTELLQRRYAGRLDERADSYIEFAVDGARRMQALINDLLAFSRVGRVGDSWMSVPLGEAVAGALSNLAAAVDESQAQIIVNPLPTVTGDLGLLTQAFQNVIGNALKFRRSDHPPVVRVSGRQVGEQWQIDVQDNGIGIDPEYADRVFVIFSRLNRKEDYPGSGIGLALTKKIVEHHGGHIRLGEHAGPGTTISLMLPTAGRRAGLEGP